MFFSGDSTTRKRVDLGGRSSKERDRQKLLEETRLERNRRLWFRQRNSAALVIQKYYRGRKAVAAERARVRDHFYKTYGRHLVNVNRDCFGPHSEFLRQLLFFFNAQNAGDFAVLVDICRLILQLARDTGDVVSLFSGGDKSNDHNLAEYRVKILAYTCIHAVYQNRGQLKDHLLLTPSLYGTSASLLLEVVVLLLDSKLPWACKISSTLSKRNVFALLRGIVLSAKEIPNSCRPTMEKTSLECIVCLMISHIGQYPCTCPDMDPRWSFPSQMLTIPFLWQTFPSLKEVFARKGLGQHYIHHMALCVQDHANVLPDDVSLEHPSYACLVGNMLEAAGITLSLPNCSFEMAINLAVVTTFLLEALPSMRSSSHKAREGSTLVEDDLDEPDEMEIGLNRDLEQQITKALDARFLMQLTNALFGGTALASGSVGTIDDIDVMAVGTACAFLHVTFNILPLERIMTVLAYRTDLVRVLWKFMKHCHENKKWPSLPEHLSYVPIDAPGWLLPLAVFCPVYKHMLTIVDNEEFYEKEKPLSLNDVKCLIIILRQALWQLLWRVSTVVSELLTQLQDWNNRRQFTPPSDFHADIVDESFISQAIADGTKANEILKRAPFLVPFTSRVKIFNSQLLAARQRNGDHGAFIRNRFRIRRDHILEDAYNQMSALSEDDLRGLIRVTFINEFGVEEAGIDGGGIFKDFMENIIRAAFDVQYGLFKATADHLLYPNPGSGMIHEQHLQFFNFLGTILGKAMFEGILVDIPFATFFLSKLKQKFNYLNDLPSLDPELYRHLIFLKHYQGDISELELYFVIVNNEYGEQKEEELLAGGKNIRVTSDNMILFIHLVSNHRLNFQIRHQSLHFLKGFQQLILKDWIHMFNEHELQLLISGSLDSLDFDDLRAHTNYAGGYHSVSSKLYILLYVWCASSISSNFSPWLCYHFMGNAAWR